MQRFCFYSSQISGQPIKQPYFGFVEGPGQPTPNVAAYATMIWLLDGAKPDPGSPLRKTGPDMWVYPFKTRRGPLLVVCARTGTTQQLSLPNAARCWDIMGAEQELPKDDKPTVTNAPVYILLKKGRRE